MTEPSFAAQLAEDLGPEDLRHVLEVFGGDVARLLGVLREAAAADDAIGFRRAAHGLAGAAGAVGASALEQECRRAMVHADASAIDAGATIDQGAQGGLDIALAAIDKLSDGALNELARYVAALDAQA